MRLNRSKFSNFEKYLSLSAQFEESNQIILNLSTLISNQLSRYIYPILTLLRYGFCLSYDVIQTGALSKQYRAKTEKKPEGPFNFGWGG